MKKSLLFLFSCSLFSNPLSLEVVQGSATLSTQENHLKIEASDHSVLHWQDFCIQKGETTQFVQPSKLSWVLNRVIGENPTEILGKLTSNGQVYLINPNGMIFHESAIIETAGFLASTLDVLDPSKLSTEAEFAGEGKLTQSGKIQTDDGNVYLFGNVVENNGQIDANECWIAAGAQIVFKPNADEKVWIKAKVGENLIENMGTIRCTQATLLSSSSPYSLAIKQDGTIDALGFVEKDGKVLLITDGDIEIRGSLSSKNKDVGGRIEVQGHRVGLFDDAFIDVSAPNGNGNVEIGNHETEQLFLGKNAKIEASAQMEGKGGRVILWGEQANRFYGQINAKGGPNAGNGGFVEISTAGMLDPQGFVDAHSEHGTAGTLLLDPTDITIVASPPAPPPPESGFVAGPPPFVFTAATSVIFNTTIQPILAAGTDLVIDTNNGFGGTGNITIGAIGTSADIIYSSVADFTLRADGDITVLDSFISNNALAGGANMTIEALNGDITLTGGVSAVGTGFVIFNGVMTVRCQNLTLTGGTAASAEAQISGGTLTNIQTTQNLIMNGGVAGGTNPRFGGFGPMNITVGGNFISRIINPGGTGNIVGTNPSLSFPTITIGVGGNIDFEAMFCVSRGDLNVSCGGNITFSGVPGGGNVSLAASQSAPFGALDVVAGGNITLGSVLAPGHGFGSGLDMTIRSGGTVTVGDNSGLNVLQLGGPFLSADMLVIADRDIIISTQAPGLGIVNNTPGAITFVVDNAFLTAPSLGPGRLILTAAPSPSLHFINRGGPIRFFTSRRSQNQIARGFFDVSAGADLPPYVPGPIFVDSGQEQWGFYFPNSFFGGPTLTIFYKEGIQTLVTAAEPGFVASGELFRNLHPFDEWLYWTMDFFTRYGPVVSQKSSMSTFDIVKEVPYSIPRDFYQWDVVELPK